MGHSMVGGNAFKKFPLSQVPLCQVARMKQMESVGTVTRNGGVAELCLVSCLQAQRNLKLCGKLLYQYWQSPCRTSKNIGMFFKLLWNAKRKSFSPDSLMVGMICVDCLLADLPTNLWSQFYIAKFHNLETINWQEAATTCHSHWSWAPAKRWGVGAAKGEHGREDA